MPQAMEAFAVQQSRQLGGSAATILTNAPELIVAPFSYSIDNLRPFDIQVYVIPRRGSTVY